MADVNELPNSPIPVLDYRLQQAEKALDHFAKTIKETEAGFRESMKEVRDEFRDGLQETNRKLAEMTEVFINAQVCEKRVEKLEGKVENHEALVKALSKLADFVANKTTKRLGITLALAYIGTRPDWAWIGDWLKSVLAALG